MKKMKLGLDKWGTPCYDDVTEGNQPTVTTEKEVQQMPTEKEIKRIELATVYEIRLLLDSDEKTEYTKEELLKILDQYARDKNTPV